MARTPKNITIDQNADFTLALTWLDRGSTEPKKVDNYTASMQIRETVTSDPIITLTEGSGIQLYDKGPYNIVIHISSNKTAMLPAPFTGLYDLLAVAPDGIKTRVIEGAVTISPAITRNV